MGGSPRTKVDLTARLRPALRQLNPDLPAEAIEQSIEELTRGRSLMTPVNASREVYRLLKHGMPVSLATDSDSEYGDEEQERKQVKKVTHDLLITLKVEKLVLDWRKRQQSRADVLVCIEDHLDRLPDAYSDDLFSDKIEATYEHIYDVFPDSHRHLSQALGSGSLQ